MMKKRALKRFAVFYVVVIALVLGFAANVNAQNSDTVWELIKGKAIDIDVGGKGAVAAINNSGQVFQYNYTEDSWRRIGKSMARIDAAANGTFWAIDQTGSVRRYTGTQWEAVGAGARDLVVSNNGIVFVVTNTDSIASYNPSTRQWAAINGQATRLAVGPTNILWRIADDGSIARRLDDAWIGVTGLAQDISISEQGRVVIVGKDGKLYEWQDNTANWQVFGGVTQAKTVSLGSNEIWRVDGDGKIYAQGITTQQRNTDENIEIGERGDGSTDPATVVDTSDLIFEAVPDTTRLADLSIGQDGSVFALTSEGHIRRWSNSEERFLTFPGQVNRLVVQDSGLPLAIGTNDNLVEHDGEAWRQSNLALSLIDLTLTKDDRVLVINSDEQSARLNEARTSYELLKQRGQQIAAQNDGSFWVIDSSKRLFKCTVNVQCARQSINATDISIGPADSVFIIDTNATLRRFNKDTGDFDIIATRQGNTAHVAVGPRDRPWIIDNRGQVLQAGYFPRDESRDRPLAQKTTATANITTEEPNVSTNTGIQIVKSVSFNNVTVPTSAPGFPSLGTGLRDITAGANDIVMVTGFKDPCVNGTGLNWVYDPVTKAFHHLDYLKRINLYTVIAVDNLIIGDVNGNTPPTSPNPAIPSLVAEWNKNCGNQSILTTYVSSVFNNPSAMDTQNFDEATFSLPLPLTELPDIDFAADGTIANIAPGNTLELFQPETANDVDGFTDISFLRVGIGVNKDDIWVVSTTNNVYEYIPTTNNFTLRSVNQIDKAQDVGVGQDGTVFIVNMQGQLRKWDLITKSFTATNKRGVTRVAVDSRGNPIVGNFPASQTISFGR
tara:strand:- start:488 stop:3001 length:2514 start_codon:yes stop_codon:yes gene_type:complete